MKKIFHQNKTFVKYINADTIQKRIASLAINLNSKYSKQKVLFICVLNGALPFFEDLLKLLNFNFDVDHIKISSYKGVNRHKINFEKSISINTFEKYSKVIIIEDIIDSGNTVKYLQSFFTKIQDKVLIFTLLVKENKINLCDWYGFKIENKYVIGYGLDINNLFRDLKHIYIQKDEEKR